jgi:hypothetical protein
VRSTIATRADGVIDCDSASGPCAVVVVSLVDDRDRAGVPIAFAGAPSSAAELRAASAGGPPISAVGDVGIPDAYLWSAGRVLRDGVSRRP